MICIVNIESVDCIIYANFQRFNLGGKSGVLHAASVSCLPVAACFKAKTGLGDRRSRGILNHPLQYTISWPEATVRIQIGKRAAATQIWVANRTIHFPCPRFGETGLDTPSVDLAARSRFMGCHRPAL